ncbi:DegT/DnrJ/EryC1/StrS family aminotransferase [Candidatus Pelagibacter sp. Uisw_137]|jgi:perosamine synthetase|uniref:DegT/DnrJ/EryC1/StrS family aminotransferase n=1 Tax=Candidatus Pelagibacter sp. Uisw_137 TaxID=3230992 RepID=UPI0039EC62E7|tara:strand:- start:672 stop:1820 length:1149 start_codon:yes stop_codon:yes gene_type:complete
MKKELKSKKYNFIPVNKPLITSEDLNYLNKSISKGWVSSEGPEVKRFENNFSNFIGNKYSVAVSSGTAALEIAIKSLKLKKGDEVIIPNFTIISNAMAVLKEGLNIKLVDCNIKDWNMDIIEIEKKITKKTKAIIATHIYNFPLRVDILKKICRKNKIILVEDAAEVIGQKLNNKLCGSYGDISIFSFYANKQITTGEGGMITTNSKKLYKQSKSLRNLCFGKQDRFNHEDIGWNYRMTNLQASLGVSQLKRIRSIVGRRHRVGNEYFQKLKDNKNIYIPETTRSYAKNIYWVIAFVITNKNLKIDGKKLMKMLLKYGIQTRPFFWPMHKQKVFKEKYKINTSGKYKNSEYISKYGLYLPSSLDIKSNQIKFICNKVNSILK